MESFLKNKRLIGVFFLILFLAVLTISFQVPMLTDDYCWAKSATGFLDMVNLTYHTYMTWSGEFSVMFIELLVLWKGGHGLFIANFINAFCFCTLIYLIFVFSYSRRPTQNRDLINLVFTLGLVWFAVSALGEVIFWKVGAMAYLWTTTSLLLFIYPYYQLLRGQVILRPGFLWNVIYALSGFLVAPFSANTTLTILCFIYFVVGHLFKNKQKIPVWSLAGAVSYLIGSILLFIAPGNYQRAKVIQSMNPGMHDDFLHKLFPFSVSLFYYFAPLLLILLIVSILKFKKNFYRVFKQKRTLLFLGLSFMCAYVMIVTPTPFSHFDPRVFFFSEVLLIILIMSLLPQEYNFKGVRRFIFQAFLVGLLCALSYSIIKTYAFYTRVHQEQVQREHLIQKAIQENNLSPILPAYYGTNPQNDYHINSGSLYVEDITIDKNYWINQCVSTYYGLGSIQAENTAGVGAPNTKFPSWVITLANYLGLKI